MIGQGFKSSYSHDRTILALWLPNSDLYVYQFSNNHTSITNLGSITHNNTRANLTQSVSFSYDNRFLILEMDDEQPVKIVSLDQASLLSIRSFNFTGTINKAMFLDSQNNCIVLFNDTSAILYDFATLTFLQTQHLSIHTSII